MSAADVMAGIKAVLEADATLSAWVSAQQFSRQTVLAEWEFMKTAPGVGELPHVMITSDGDESSDQTFNTYPDIEQAFGLTCTLPAGAKNLESMLWEFIGHLRRVFYDNYTLDGSVYNCELETSIIADELAPGVVVARLNTWRSGS